MSIVQKIDSFLQSSLGEKHDFVDAIRLQDWINDYLRACESDHVESLVPHLNLWMLEDFEGESPFVVVAFFPDRIEIIAGLGDGSAVRSAAEHTSSSKPQKVFQTLRRQFNIVRDPLRIEQSETDRWLKGKA